MPDASTHWRLTGKIESPTGMTPVAGLLVPKLTRTVIDPDTGKTVLHVEPVTHGGVPFLNGTVDLWLPKGQQIALTVIVERGPRLYKLLAPRSVDGTVAEVVGTWDTDPGALLTGGAVVSQVELSAAMERIDSTELAARTAVTNAQQASALATSAATQAREAAVLAVAPADTAVASLMGAASQTQAAGDERWSRNGALAIDVASPPYRADPTGATDATVAIQQALNDGKALGRKVVASGTFKISDTLTIQCNADFGAAVINSTATGVSIRIGALTGLILCVDVTTPKTITNKRKTAPGWDAVIGSVGVELSNIYGSRVQMGSVQRFETGVRLWGYGAGVCYNDVSLGHIGTSRTALLLGADNTGWANQNTLRGGRLYMDVPNEGKAIPGTSFIKMVSADMSIPNTNTFIGTSVEADGPEYHLDVDGEANMFVNVRFENAAGCRVIWRANARRNVIQHGYGESSIKETHEESGAITNLIESTIRTYYSMAGGVGGCIVGENTAGSAHPVFSVMPTGSKKAGTSTATGYTGAWSANGIAIRRAGEANDRLVMNSTDGRFYIGNGTVKPSNYIGAFGALGFMVAGTFAFATDNTHDVGATGYRPRDVHAARHVRLGSLWLRDNGGKLEVSKDGTAWSAVTLATA